jgi:hypothetical protein
MKLTLTLMLGLVLGLAGTAQAHHHRTGLRTPGTPVVIVGQVTSAPHKVAGAVQKRFQIALGPNRGDVYTLHIGDADMVGLGGEKFAASDLDDKQWVRAEGTLMDNPHRIKVSRLEVVGKDTESVKKTKYYHENSERGYIEEVTAPKPQ